ncbi:YdeI/OmpD-associated family protein [Luteipulveratus flavus]|uniref:YdeI/OmpD-associated family protein n=1 Tax=Luteipulveratus flavus TaxID=3031728 RepID=A0ABT6C9W0_9MICO|nr:YdeI/OmpD-associated family protein [Luteipulveratus sp. YIM 133296]MDF8265694.1 YdeI/OmpD-associated family protein [Luteipulveratus sp. YIM 133296]
MTGSGASRGSSEPPVLFFADAAEWRAWLEAHHADETQVWMGLYKKHVAERGLVWEDAVVEALCFGWIDSVFHRIDDDSVRQRWTPRKRTSTWSAVNLATVERLISEGRMRPAGLAAYEARRPDRQRIYSYEQESIDWPAAYEERILAVPEAAAFWAYATPGYRKNVQGWVVGAKQEATRERRLTTLIEDCAAGRLIKSQRYGGEPGWARRARESLGLVAEQP